MFIEPTIKCGADWGGGETCQEFAHVIDTELIYREEFEDGRFQQVVDEVYVTIECPKCGTWTRAETVHSNYTYATS